MAFEQKTWTDRLSEYPTRRQLTKSDGSTEIVDVARLEGTISQEGDAFSAENMNNLEQRIADEFSELNNALTVKYGEDDYLYVLVDGKYVKTSYKMYARDWVLYRDGVFTSDFSKTYTYSYNSAYATSYKLTFYDTYFTATVAGGRDGENYAYFHATFASPIDVTNYSKLVIESPDANCRQWYVGLNSAKVGGSSVYNCTSDLANSANWLENEDGTYTLTLDISGVKGLAYVAFGSQVVGEITSKFTKIYLQ